MQLHGVFAAATTPFEADTCDVDVAGFRRNAQFLLDTSLAGLVLFGKTTSPELRLSPSTESILFGKTRNPWKLERTPGGSSGGAAAAV